MTRKDYVAIAAALLKTRPLGGGTDFDPDYSQWSADVRALMAVFGHDNADFNPGRFRKAVGLDV